MGQYYYPHFLGEKNEAQGHIYSMEELGLNPQFGCKAQCLSQ